LYEIRKKSMLEKLEHDLLILKQKRKFIDEVDKGSIQVFRVPEDGLIQQLKEKNYEAIDDYAHLLNIPVRDFTRSKLNQLDEKISRCEAECAHLREKEPASLWCDELQGFLKEYLTVV